MLNVMGPVIVFLPALPYAFTGVANASGFNTPLMKTGAPGYSPRHGPVIDDPPSVFETIMGVSQAPLDMLMLVVTVQPFSNTPFHPLINAPPRAPMPLLYCADMFSE